MRKILIVLLSLILIIGCTPEEYPVKKSPEISIQSDFELPNDFLTYNNYGVKIGYPNHWTKTDNPYEKVIVFFSSPLESSTDKFSENINIVIEDVSFYYSNLDEYKDYTIKNMPKFVKNFKLISSSRVAINELPASEMVFSSRQEGIDLKQLQITTIKDNKAYILTYSAESDNYAQYLDEVNNMINSLEILGFTELSLKPGETAKTSELEVTVKDVDITDSIGYLYDGEERTKTATEGKKLIFFETEIKNIGADEEYVYDGEFSMTDSEGYKYETESYYGDNRFRTQSLYPQQKSKGKILFEIPEDSTDLKIQYNFGSFDVKLASWNIE